MNKKFYLGALALPLMMAACSSEDTLSEVQGVKDQYEGIAKVDATFTLDGAQSRLASTWDLEEGDKIGMAWLGVPEVSELYGSNSLTGANGWAYQNHPLKATGNRTLKPETSIYVGKYFIYYPYDTKTQQLQNIAFNIAEQPLNDEGSAKAAANSIWLSSALTDVTLDGDEYNKNKAGEDCRFDVKARQLTNLVALNAAWKNNDVLEEKIEAPIIDSIMVGYKAGEEVTSVIGFEYAPKNFENGYQPSLDDEYYWGHFNLLWESAPAEPQSRVAAEDNRIIKLKTSGIYATGFEEIETGMIKLKAAEGGYTVEGNNAKFFYNALPATDKSKEISLRVLTDYGVIDYTLAMNEAAMTADYKTDANGEDATGYLENFDGSQEISEDGQIMSLEGEAEEVLTAVPVEGSFMNRLYKTGKILAQIDFFDAKIDGMHIKNDAHLQKLLKFYILKTEAGYVENNVTLYLDEDEDNEFKISKTSIALMQSINANDNKVELVVCDEHEGDHVVVVTHNEEEGKEVPSFNDVFGEKLEVYLEDQDWTWNEAEAKNNGNVTKIHNRGNLTIGSTNVEFDETQVKSRNVSTSFIDFVNLKDAKITFTAGVASLWKINLTNNGTINIPATAHMRVYSYVVNNVTELTGVRQGNMGIIDNYGVFGAVEDQEGEIDNFGKIYHRAGAKTFITNNAENEDFSHALNEKGTKIGIIEMSEADANVSVSNQTDKGIITYTWSKDEPVYASPAVVRYNYLIVEGNIEFTETEAEIRYLEINGNDVYVTNKGKLSKLQGVIVAPGKSLNITEGNQLKPSKAAYLKGYVYNGGVFEYNKDVLTYFGGDAKDIENILKWTGF